MNSWEGVEDASLAVIFDVEGDGIEIVIPTAKAESITLDLKGTQLTGEGMSWVIAGRDKMAHNDPGRRRVVDIRSEPVRGGAGELKVPALGVALYELRVK